MKLSKKILSVVLAVMMVFSMAGAALAGALKTETYDTVEKLIQNDSLGNILDSLVTNINDKKADMAGTVLRLVLTFVNDDGLNAAKGDTDIATASDDALAKIVLDWLDKSLPEWTKDITSQDWYGPVSNLVRFIGITLDLKSVNGVIKTVDSLCDKADDKIFGRPVINLGIANDLKRSSLNGLSRSKGDLNVIFGLLQWLKDNMPVVKKALNGNLNLGLVSNFVDLDDVANSLKNIPLFAKSYLYLLIDGNAAAGKFDKDAAAAKGDWGNSPYADYNADELLAAALIRLIKNNDEIVSKEDADAALSLSLYDLLTTYAADLFHNFAIDPINENLPKFIESISVTKEIKAVFKAEIPAVDDATIADLIENAKTTGVLGQVNNLLVKLADLILVPAEFKKLALKEGGNENLNANLEKIFKLILPLMANKTVSEKLGYDFSEFTAANVKSMDIKQMAVAVLKLFFGYWFDNNPNYSVAAVDSAKTPEQLAALAVYYTATHTGWLNVDYDFSAFSDRLFEDGKMKTLTREEATDAMVAMGVGIGYGALKHNAASTNYKADLSSMEYFLLGDVDDTDTITAADARLALRRAVNLETYEAGSREFLCCDVDKNEEVTAADARTILRMAVGLDEQGEQVSVGSAATWQEMADDICDWALNYVKGVPAAVKAKGVTTQREVYDPLNDGVFNKLNLVVNQLIDFRFLSNVGSADYALDFQTLLFDGLLGNLLDFDVAGILGIFERNANEGNLFNAPNTVVNAVLKIADRAVSCLFTVQ